MFDFYDGFFKNLDWHFFVFRWMETQGKEELFAARTLADGIGFLQGIRQFISHETT